MAPRIATGSPSEDDIGSVPTHWQSSNDHPDSVLDEGGGDDCAPIADTATIEKKLKGFRQRVEQNARLIILSKYAECKPDYSPHWARSLPGETRREAERNPTWQSLARQQNILRAQIKTLKALDSSAGSAAAATHRENIRAAVRTEFPKVATLCDTMSRKLPRTEASSSGDETPDRQPEVSCSKEAISMNTNRDNSEHSQRPPIDTDPLVQDANNLSEATTLAPHMAKSSEPHVRTEPGPADIIPIVESDGMNADDHMDLPSEESNSDFEGEPGSVGSFFNLVVRKSTSPSLLPHSVLDGTAERKTNETTLSRPADHERFFTDVTTANNRSFPHAPRADTLPHGEDDPGHNICDTSNPSVSPIKRPKTSDEFERESLQMELAEMRYKARAKEIERQLLLMEKGQAN